MKETTATALILLAHHMLQQVEVFTDAKNNIAILRRASFLERGAFATIGETRASYLMGSSWHYGSNR